MARLKPGPFKTSLLRRDLLCQQGMSRLTRLPVRGEHLRNGCWVRFRGSGEHFFNCTRDAHKGDAAVEKGFYGDFVGGVEGDGVGAAFFRSV